MTDLKELGLSKPLYQLLRRKGFNSVEKLLPLSYWQILAIPDIGQERAAEIIARVRAYLNEQNIAEEFPRLDVMPRNLGKADIRYMKFSTNAERRLRDAGISTIKALLAITEPQLMAVQKCGDVMREEIIRKTRAFMAEMGIGGDFPRSETPEGETSLAAIGLDARIANCLMRAGVPSAERLFCLSEEEILHIRGIGSYSAGEIREKLQAWLAQRGEP